MVLIEFKYEADQTVKYSRLCLNEQFPDLIAQAGCSYRAFARQAGVSFSTVMGLLHPHIHPGRRGGMQRRTAWRLAQAYAEITGIERDAAFRLLITEYPEMSEPTVQQEELHS